MEAVSKFLTEHMTEPVWVGILFTGMALIAIAYYWLAIRAVRVSKWWRIGYLPPFAFFYLVSLWRSVLGPLLLLAVGAALAVAPLVATHYVMPQFRQYPWERTVDGELHVTLTGLPNFDYSLLKDRRHIDVLQMANAEVTDQTLDILRGMEKLKELDISNSQVTDAGLAALKALPNLRTLRIAHTKVTDEGFSQNLKDSGALMEIDARDTGIKGSTLRNWKKAKDERKYLN